MAMAGARFAASALAALQGEEQVVECAFVQSTVTASPYFSTPLVLDVSPCILQASFILRLLMLLLMIFFRTPFDLIELCNA